MTAFIVTCSLLWELVRKFGVIFHIFIISCLCSRFHVRNQWFFLLCNNLFIYQVLCTLIYRRRSLYSFLLYYLQNTYWNKLIFTKINAISHIKPWCLPLHVPASYIYSMSYNSHVWLILRFGDIARHLNDYFESYLLSENSAGIIN